MDNLGIGTVTRRGGLTPSSLAISFTPLLTLLTSNRLGALEVAVLQIFTIFLVQFISIFSKSSSTSGNDRIKEIPVSSTVQVEKEVEPQPIKVEIVNGESEGRIQKERASSSKRSSAKSKVDARLEEILPEPDGQPAVLESTISDTIEHIADSLPRRIPSRAIPEHALYSNESIDSCLRHFLAILDAPQLKHLPPGVATVPPELPLSSWEQLLHTSTSRVCKHPSIPHLYAISAVYPDVPLRNLWELLIDIKNRPKWDSMCYATEEIEEIGLVDQSEAATRQAVVTYLATKGMFPVKANDMVLLSVNARLLPHHPTRLVCATTSVEHPTKPAFRSYTRMKLSVSGFIAEDDGMGGSRVTQLTDLSALGSWVPTKLIKMVTETMIPKSLVKIGQTAKEYQLEGPRAALKGDAWLPPVIGSWDAPSEPTEAVEKQKSKPVQSKSSTDDETSESDQDDVSDADEASDTLHGKKKLPASASRDIKELVVQLRSVNNRLAHLERASVAQQSNAIVPANTNGSIPLPNGHSGYHPPATPFGVSKVTDNALTSQQPMGWMSKIANTLSLQNFLSGLGAGIFSTTTAAALAAIVVYWVRKRR